MSTTATLDPARAMSTAISDAYDQLRQLVETFAGRRDDPQLLEEVGAVRRRALGRFNRAKKKTEPQAAQPAAPAPRAAEPAPAPKSAAPEAPPATPKAAVPAAVAQPSERVSVRLTEPVGKPAAAQRSAPAPFSTPSTGRHRTPEPPRARWWERHRVPRWLSLLAIAFVVGVAVAMSPLWAIVGAATGCALALLVQRVRRTAGRAR